MKIKALTLLTLALALFMSACGKSDADLQKAVQDKLAADKVTGVTVAVKDGVATLTGEVADITVKTNAEASAKVGNQCIVVAIDAKQSAPGVWQVFTHGGRRNTGIDAVAWARRVQQLGAGEILLTSMDRDGTRNGFDLSLTRAISDAVDVPVIASGGVGNLQHLADGVSEGHADAVLAASIFHFGEFTVRQAKEYMRERGIEVRL